MAEQTLTAWLFSGKGTVIQWVGTTTFATRTKHHLFAAKGFVQVNIIRGTHFFQNNVCIHDVGSFRDGRTDKQGPTFQNPVTRVIRVKDFHEILLLAMVYWAKAV